MIYPFSLKAATKVRWQGGQAPVYYHITETMHIAKVPMKRLLSRRKAKMDLTIYLGQKFKEYADRSGRQLVVAWGSERQATQGQGTFTEPPRGSRHKDDFACPRCYVRLMVQPNYRFTLRIQMSSSLLLRVIRNCARTRCLSREEGNTIGLLS